MFLLKLDELLLKTQSHDLGVGPKRIRERKEEERRKEKRRCQPLRPAVLNMRSPPTVVLKALQHLQPSLVNRF